MDYDTYMELYEAVYFFNQTHGSMPDSSPQSFHCNSSGCKESVVRAAVRILAVSGLLHYDGTSFWMSGENREKYRRILKYILGGSQKEHYLEMYQTAVNDSSFFFDDISETEYDIYSRYNFQITFELGKKVGRHVNFRNKKVLELGGNSGGLATALLAENKDCRYTVVDTQIPCIVGNELKELNGLKVTFVESDIFELTLPRKPFDFLILMNLLHDFDDEKCLTILRNCMAYCSRTTKFIIIEDILTSEIEPREAIMHGLRLAVSCNGGKQRTMEELENLFSSISYKLETAVKLDGVHTMLVLESCEIGAAR